jgi:hypothetical protein
LAGTITVLTAALTAVIGTAVLAGANAPARTDGPVAVVLMPESGRSELVVIDLERAVVARRVVLRSLVTDIAGDPASGTLVGAQTGGVGGQADDALSIVDPRSGGVRYVTLPRSDPSQVACVAGRAFVLHAWVDAAGYVVSVVDVASATVTATLHAPDGTGMWDAAGGNLWTVAAPMGGPSRSLTRMDPAALRRTVVACAGIDPTAVIADGDGVIVLGSSTGGQRGTGSAALLDSGTGSIVMTATIPGLPHGAQIGAVADGALVVGDWVGESPESNALAVLDDRTLEPIGNIRVGSAPCALAGYRDRLLVVDRVEGVLRCVDPRTGKVRWSVDLGVRDLLCSKVVVLDGRVSAAR